LPLITPDYFHWFLSLRCHHYFIAIDILPFADLLLLPIFFHSIFAFDYSWCWYFRYWFSPLLFYWYCSFIISLFSPIIIAFHFAIISLRHYFLSLFIAIDAIITLMPLLFHYWYWWLIIFRYCCWYCIHYFRHY
jgi:hypothetical protein